MHQTTSFQPWLSQFANNTSNQHLLEIFAIRGLATKEQCLILRSDLSEKQQRNLLSNWSQGNIGKPALLRTLRTSYERQRGNPPLVYLLTDTGANLLHQLNDKDNSLVPKLETKVEVVHAVAEMDVFARAQQAKVNCFIEKLFYFGPKKENIRADIAFVTSENVFRLIEIEQTAQPDNVSRITDKLLHLMNFFLSGEERKVDEKILVLFNVASDDQQTITIWQNVVAALEKKYSPLPYQLLAENLLDFLEKPVWQDWSQYPAIKMEQAVAEAKRELVDASLNATPPFLEHRPIEANHFDIILDVLKKDLLQTVTESAEDNQRIFFNLALIIYAGSHYPDSPVVTKSAFPSISLALLYRYLHANQNQGLLETIKREIRDLLRANVRGANLFRDAFSHLAWTLLRHYGFGRGGPLQVLIKVPSFNDERSDIHIDMKWETDSSMQETYGLALFALEKPSQKGEYLPYWQSPSSNKNNWQVLTAVAWLLNALWVYMEDLGLQSVDARKKKA